MEHEREFRESRPSGRRKAVMRYNETEELEATSEWLMRVNGVGFSEELMYVPSQLTKLGVAPVDVVDRLEWLRENDHDTNRSDHDKMGDVPEIVQEAELEVEPASEVQLELALAVEMLEERPRADVLEVESLVLDYNRYGAWEWAGPMEKMVEDAIIGIRNLELGLHEFNELARPKKRIRGKRARAARAVKIPDDRVDELVGNSVDASAR